MSVMKKLIMLLTMSLIFAMPSVAQHFNLSVVGEDGLPASGVEIWVFAVRKNAENANTKFMNGGSLTARDGVMDHQTSAGRNLQLRGNSECFLLYDDQHSDVLHIVGLSTLKTEIQGGEVVYKLITAKKGYKKNQIGGDLKADTIKGEIGIKERSQLKGTATPCGHKIPYTKPLTLDKNYTSTYSRFVAAPYIVEIKNGQDSLLDYLYPVVMDGTEYHNTSLGRFGYKRKSGYDENDLLGKYVIGRRMGTRTEDDLMIEGQYNKYDETKKYKIYADTWYEDYNTVYNKKRIVVWNGKPSLFQRYLDWKSSIPNSQIDTSRYDRKEYYRSIPFEDHLRIQFKKGEAEIDTSDSISVANLNSIVKKYEQSSTQKEVASAK